MASHPFYCPRGLESPGLSITYTGSNPFMDQKLECIARKDGKAAS